MFNLLHFRAITINFHDELFSLYVDFKELLGQKKKKELLGQKFLTKNESLECRSIFSIGVKNSATYFNT